MTEDYFKYWGKHGSEERDYHLLAFHCLDAAAVAYCWLSSDRLLLERLAALTGLPQKNLVNLVAWLIGLHDIGKFALSFQGLKPELLSLFQGPRQPGPYLERHDLLGLLAWQRVLIPAWLKEGWWGLVPEEETKRQLTGLLKILVQPSAGHHGRPVSSTGRNPELTFRDNFFDQDQAALLSFSRQLGRILESREPVLAGLDPLAVQEGFKLASWLLAGLTVACDWLASNERFFADRSRPMSLETYWPLALDQAGQALDQSGLLVLDPAPFQGLTHLFPWITRPTPLQDHLASCDLEPGPKLFILEDSTGSGKTEAALTLAHRIMAAGEAESLFLALPTMATANAMHGRLSLAYRRFFADQANPSLVLAHSARKVHRDFTRTVAWAPDLPEQTPGGEEGSGSAQCAAWLADSNKKALLASVGVGTVDQAVFGALPVNHQALRLLGLGRSILVVDEVHAYDPYLTQLLSDLLSFQAGLGGSAILLSATLDQQTRAALAGGFTRGLGLEQPEPAQDQPYTLATSIQAGALIQKGLSPRPGLEREIDLDPVDEERLVEERLIEAAQAGGCACWIRNTVADALVAYDSLVQRLGPDQVFLFHARLAMVDRLAVEEKVLAWFGPRSQPRDRAGRVLVATQVVEQSLDLDFDLLATDLAPMDLLIQRAGRLHRHHRPSRPLALPRLVVLTPEPVPDPDSEWFSRFLSRAARVYPRHGRLWLTARLLANGKPLKLPAQARELVEAVFKPQAINDLPEPLREVEEKVQGIESADRSLAWLNGLDPWQGYRPGHVPWEEDTPTRLGEPTTVLRLARWENGRLSPWAGGGTTLDWELSQVRVRQWQVKDRAPTKDRDLARAVIEAEKEMPDKDRICLLPLEPAEGESWRGEALDGKDRVVDVRYSALRGFV